MSFSSACLLPYCPLGFGRLDFYPLRSIGGKGVSWETSNAARMTLQWLLGALGSFGVLASVWIAAGENGYRQGALYAAKRCRETHCREIAALRAIVRQYRRGSDTDRKALDDSAASRSAGGKTGASVFG